ncbi:MAG: NAD/NADP octopine/nopaline dehydrogenase family protein [Polaromonas sp.]|nr:NAD/NADP octopine/nopaline dehydrogenase family protein [Polaromonas sp.]
MRVGIAGAGAIALASAAWMANRNHEVALWSPRNNTADALRDKPLVCGGVLDASYRVGVVDSAEGLAEQADVLLIAVPANGHRAVFDKLLPHLRNGQLVIVSSMSSLSSLYLYESATTRGISIEVASFGSTVLTARRESAAHVRIMTQRKSLGVSCLPRSAQQRAISTCQALFGDVFTADENALSTALTNINPVAHGPLALLNWTRIERGESWPQYQFMTQRVAAVIEQLDAERIAVASAFGLQVRSIERHFLLSFGTSAERLVDIAAELHEKRGGPPGPIEIQTRFLTEDVPFGLVFTLAMSRLAKVPTPATAATAAMAGVVIGVDFSAANDLLPTFGLAGESVDGLLSRVNVDR